MSLYILLLENDKYLLHLSKEKSKDQVIIDCKVLYGFAKKNSPKDIINVIPIYDFLEIDYHVKKYMYFYGVDNVRGGSYIDEVLPDYMLRTLNIELSYTVDMQIENIETVDSFKEKYKNWKDIAGLKYEKIQLLKKIKSYQDAKYKLELVNYYYDSVNIDNQSIIDDINTNNNFELNDKLVESIVWCRDWIIQFNDKYKKEKLYSLPSQEEYRKYENLTKMLAVLFLIYSNVLGIELIENSKNPIFLINPETVLDIFFIENEDKDEILEILNENDVNINDIIEFLNSFIDMLYQCINRIDEYKFDVEYYGGNFEKETKYEIEYLDMKIKDIDAVKN